MVKLSRINTFFGWAVFLISTLVYILTVEPTASFWDCGEFIACAYKLQVPHPPGAPLFLLIGRFFSFLAFGDVTKVAYWINISSALASGATILFLFWSITFLARKLVLENYKTEEVSIEKAVLIIGAGAVGALAYAFSDSFWFSAVEAEVYAMSSFFTAFVFWAILKWDFIADEPEADRWLVLIAYMMGLSIGVHLLNLVTIPALALVYYYRKYTATFKGVIIASVVGLGIIGIIQVAIIPGLPTLAGKFEVLFVNALKLPFGSGAAAFILLFVALLTMGVLYTIKNAKYHWNIALICLIYILIGYASYAIILIRSNFNPPIDENNPEDVMSFVSYLKREQYGDRPLIYGPSYMSELIDQEQGEPLYRKGDKKYEIYDYKTINKFDPKGNMLLPRLHSRQPGHAAEYARWTGKPEGRRPTMGDNLTFLFKYQLGHMYFRYFLWNFAGREGDTQDSGWLRPWDTAEGLPEQLAKNKARNNFYMLPLLLGLLGFVFQFGKDKKNFLVLLYLFVLTGIALVIYLNPPPVEPRERDYIYVGSFYAFAIWIGLGVLSVADYLSLVIKKLNLRAAVAVGLSLVVPGVMIAEGWDDHDRSQRYHSVDSAKNLLNSCAPNAILFTGGDNDTFPLWYVQEVEGFRTDVRVCNLSLLNTDWYINQMKRKAYDSEPLPISLELKDYIQGKNDYLPFVENPNGKNGISLPVYIDLIKKSHPAVTVQAAAGSKLSVLPSEILILPVDSAYVASKDWIPTDKKSKIPSQIVWRIGRRAIDKATLVMLDMITTANWDRPIYFSSTLGSSNYLNLREYMQMEGLAYRLTPIRQPGASQGYVNTEIMYDKMMHGMWFRNLNKEGVYYDENYRRFPYNARLSFYRLAAELLNEGQKEKAIQVVEKCLEWIPDKTIPYDITTPQLAAVLLRAGQIDKAMEIFEVLRKRADEELGYYLKNNIRNDMEIQTHLYIINQIGMVLKSEGLYEEAKPYDTLFRRYTGEDIE